MSMVLVDVSTHELVGSGGAFQHVTSTLDSVFEERLTSCRQYLVKSLNFALASFRESPCRGKSERYHFRSTINLSRLSPGEFPYLLQASSHTLVAFLVAFAQAAAFRPPEVSESTLTGALTDSMGSDVVIHSIDSWNEVTLITRETVNSPLYLFRGQNYHLVSDRFGNVNGTVVHVHDKCIHANSNCAAIRADVRKRIVHSAASNQCWTATWNTQFRQWINV